MTKHLSDCESLQAELNRQDYGIHLCICPALRSAYSEGYDEGIRVAGSDWP